MQASEGHAYVASHVQLVMYTAACSKANDILKQHILVHDLITCKDASTLPLAS